MKSSLKCPGKNRLIHILYVIENKIDNQPRRPWNDRSNERKFYRFLPFAFEFFIDPTKDIHQSTDKHHSETDIAYEREEIVGDVEDDAGDFIKRDISFSDFLCRDTAWVSLQDRLLSR